MLVRQFLELTIIRYGPGRSIDDRTAGGRRIGTTTGRAARGVDTGVAASGLRAVY
jgi:hypothetical protein